MTVCFSLPLWTVFPILLFVFGPDKPWGSQRAIYKRVTAEVPVMRNFSQLELRLPAWLTHSDPGVHAESLYQHVVEDDSQQSHQDVCQTHVEHYGRSWNTHKSVTHL